MTIKDQVDYTLEVQVPARRIVSLVPSQTELLSDLELNSEVVGLTRFCVHPEGWLKMKTKIGGTKNVNIKRVKSLNPDLIVANKEENVLEQIEELRQHFPVYTSDIKTIQDTLAFTKDIGVITGREDQAHRLVQKINELMSAQPSTRGSRKKTAYVIWKDPYMVAGEDTFIHEMLDVAGLDNYYKGLNRYPEIQLEDWRTRAPNVIMLSSEPYAFKESHVEEIQAQFPESKVLLVNGEMFSWYGSRLIQAIPYVRNLSI